MRAVLEGCKGSEAPQNSSRPSNARPENVDGLLGPSGAVRAGSGETGQEVRLENGVWAWAGPDGTDGTLSSWINAWMVVVPIVVLLAAIASICAGARLMAADDRFKKWPSIVFPVASVVGGMLQVVAVGWIATAGRPGASGLDATAADALREEVFRFATGQPGVSGLRAAGCGVNHYSLGDTAGVGWAAEMQAGLPGAEGEAARRIPIPGPLPACTIEAGISSQTGVAPDALWTADSATALDPERVAVASSLQAVAKAVTVRVTVGGGCATQGVLAWSFALGARLVMIWLLDMLKEAMSNTELKGDKLAPYAAARARFFLLLWVLSSIAFGIFAGATGVWRPGVEGCVLEGPGIVKVLFVMPLLVAALAGTWFGWRVMSEANGYLQGVADAEARSRRLREEEEAEREEAELPAIDWDSIGNRQLRRIDGGQERNLTREGIPTEFDRGSEYDEGGAPLGAIGWASSPTGSGPASPGMDGAAAAGTSSGTGKRM